MASTRERCFPRSFFLGPTLEVARGLLGALLVRDLTHLELLRWVGEAALPAAMARNGLSARYRLVGRIVETEAYLQHDGACHAVRTLSDGTCTPRRSARNASMFGHGGRAYVYFTYGAHFALNVVTQAQDIAEAVLVRALEPVEGLDVMSVLRSTAGKRASAAGSSPRIIRDARHLCSGPGKLARALALDRDLDGHDLSLPPLRLIQGAPVARSMIGVSSRIGITRALEKPWRFYELGNPHVSRP